MLLIFDFDTYKEDVLDEFTLNCSEMTVVKIENYGLKHTSHYSVSQRRIKVALSTH